MGGGGEKNGEEGDLSDGEGECDWYNNTFLKTKNGRSRPSENQIWGITEVFRGKKREGKKTYNVQVDQCCGV